MTEKVNEDHRATREGTGRYAERMSRQGVPTQHFRDDGVLTYSSIGLGTYLGNCDSRTDDQMEQAVLRAMGAGCNVMDTAINYRCQRSERSIGRALRAAVRDGRVRRDEVIVSTKGGYLPFDGAPPPDAPEYFDRTFVGPGLLKRGDIVAGCHAMSPAFLQDQINRSLENLGLSCIDIYYLHNPETQLGQVSQDKFRSRLRKAFLTLEDNVSQGKIGVYGAATWNAFRVPPAARDYISLSDLTETAREIGGVNHHFRVVQFPYNLAMSEALTEPTQRVGSDTVCLLEAADLLGIYVMTSVPLYQGKLSRGLPAVLNQTFPGLQTDAQRAIQYVRSTPKTGTALVGMKVPAHVEENMRLALVPSVPSEQFMKLFSEES